MAQDVLIINGLVIPVQSYDFSKKEQDLDSGVNLNGVMERNILGHHRRTIDIVLPPLDRNLMHFYLTVFDNPYLTIQAFDIFTNQVETMTMYHGDLNPSLYWNPDDMLYNAMKIQLVEY